MKRIFTFLILLSALGTAKAQLFSQNFNSSSTLSDFFDATTPGTTKFNSISSSGAGTTVSINSSKLRYVRTGNAGSYTRTTDFSPVPTFMKYAFEFTMSGNSTAQTTALTLQVGDGFSTTNSTEANASVHSRIAFNITATAGEFQIRNLTGSANSSNLSGAQNIVWIINNSGGSKNYTAPDGNTESIADDTYDVWAGTTRIFNDIAATTTTKTLADIKMVWSAGSATVDFDNFEITDLDAALPISLVKFEAEKLAEKVKLTWATATEINNQKFIVERASNGEDFTSIAEIKGAGNSKELNEYTFVDANPFKGTAYYRLTQVDFDGTSTSFEPVAVSSSKGQLSMEQGAGSLEQGVWSIYSPIATEALIDVKDINGKVIYSEKVQLKEGYQHYKLNLTTQQTGIYVLQLIAGKESITKKLKLN